jgi:hypothetical protein
MSEARHLPLLPAAVPASTRGAPFNVSVKAKAPKAKMCSTLAYPSATIVDAWDGRRATFHEKQKDVLKRIIGSFQPTTISLPPEKRRDLAAEVLFEPRSPEDTEMHKAARRYSAGQGIFADGSATKWLNQVTNFNVEVGATKNPIILKITFDPSIYLEVLTARLRGAGARASVTKSTVNLNMELTHMTSRTSWLSSTRPHLTRSVVYGGSGCTWCNGAGEENLIIPTRVRPQKGAVTAPAAAFAPGSRGGRVPEGVVHPCTDTGIPSCVGAGERPFIRGAKCIRYGLPIR